MPLVPPATRMRLILDTIDAQLRAAYPNVSTLDPLHDQIWTAINGVEAARRVLVEMEAGAHA